MTKRSAWSDGMWSVLLNRVINKVTNYTPVVSAMGRSRRIHWFNLIVECVIMWLLSDNATRVKLLITFMTVSVDHALVQCNLSCVVLISFTASWLKSSVPELSYLTPRILTQELISVTAGSKNLLNYRWWLGSILFLQHSVYRWTEICNRKPQHFYSAPFSPPVLSPVLSPPHR